MTDEQIKAIESFTYRLKDLVDEEDDLSLYQIVGVLRAMHNHVLRTIAEAESIREETDGTWHSLPQ